MIAPTLCHMTDTYFSGYFARSNVQEGLQKLGAMHKKCLKVSEYISDAQVIKPLGYGAIGAVHLVKRNSDNQLYAQKEIPRSRELLLIELVALLLLEHKSIASPHEIGEISELPGYVALRMDYLKGAKPLKKIDCDKSKKLAYVLDLFKGAAKAIKHAHDRGVMHRDLKPENILVNKEGVHVIDFGCAMIKRPDLGISIIPKDDYVRGTPRYMSLESMSTASKSDFSSDIYSLVVILYEILTGRHPFDADKKSLVELLRCLMSERPIDIREISPIKNEDFAETLLAALAKDPGQRPFASTQEFVDFLENVTPEKLMQKDAMV